MSKKFLILAIIFITIFNIVLFGNYYKNNEENNNSIKINNTIK